MKIAAASTIVEVPGVTFRGDRLCVTVSDHPDHDIPFDSMPYVISLDGDLVVQGKRSDSVAFTLSGDAALNEFLSAMSALQRMRPPSP